MTETLIIFSRYPEPGKTKTRMIPVLGEEGAANLQRRLSEHTLKEARSLRKSREIEIAVYFTGGSKNLMEKWLGKDVNYYAQAEGDLGKKMRSAFAEHFAKKSQRVVIIGIDCPSLNCQILELAFDALKSNDLVLGEAADGGYYSIGLSKLFPELFINISWGTSEVFSETNKIARQLNLAIAYLPILRDLDRPEDLDLVTLIS